MKTAFVLAAAVIVLAACQTAGSPRMAAPGVCGAAFIAEGYRDGLEGRSPRQAAGCDATAREAYRRRYAAGAYVAGLEAGPLLGAGSARSLGGAGSLGGVRRDPALPAGCSPAEARAAGRLGLTQPAPCPNLPAVADSFAAGRGDAGRSAEFRSLDLEQQRLENQLIKPFLTPAERRLIQRRIDTLERRWRALGTLR